MSFLAAEWAVIKKWWSVWLGLFLAFTMTTIQSLSDLWPQVFGVLAQYFPIGAAAYGPIAGVLITLIARVTSQAAVGAFFKRIFGTDPTQPPQQ